jgi:hypothetical protein
MELRFASLSALIANVNRDRKRKPTPFKAEEFMPEFGKQYIDDIDDVMPDPEEQAEVLKTFFKRMAAVPGVEVVDKTENG